MRHVLDILDLSVQEIDELITTAKDIMASPEKYYEKCAHKKLATLFFEPSTRTRLSFEAAMLDLGGKVIGFAGASASSASKGESVADTISVVNNYVDIIAMRHPKEGAPLVATSRSGIPIINAGDGGHCHPTQTLADLLTIDLEKGRFDNLTIGFCGDLKYGRTVHSLIAAMSRYKGIKFVLISPDELKLPEYVKESYMKETPFIETASLEEAIPQLDVLYMTRIQQERFEDKAEYERLKDSYVLNAAKLVPAKEDMIILHPLPRVNEISVDVDDDKRACYFEQTKCGKLMRMALIIKLLDEAEKDKCNCKSCIKDAAKNAKNLVNVLKCENPHCITTTEQELPQIFTPAEGKEGVYHCLYCEAEQRK